MRILLFSFGFKYGCAEADYVLDLRFLPNPYWQPELRPFSGLDARVADYVLAQPDSAAFLAFVRPLLTFVCAAWAKRPREELRIALGCTGGRHRSVALAEYLAAWLRQEGYVVQCRHRDMLREEGSVNRDSTISMYPMEAVMKELLKNIMYAGLGAAFLTKEKFEELQKELIEKGKMSQEEGKAFVDELRLKSEKTRDQLETWITAQVEERVRRLNLATREDIADLQKKIDNLQSLIDKDAGAR